MNRLKSGSGASCGLGRRLEAKVDRFDAFFVLPDREGCELDRHAELYMVSRCLDVHDVGSDTRATTVDDRRDKRHLDPGGREGHDREGSHYALGRDVDRLEVRTGTARAGVPAIKEARTTGCALVGDEMGGFTKNEVVDEGNWFGQWGSLLGASVIGARINNGGEGIASRRFENPKPPSERQPRSSGRCPITRTLLARVTPGERKPIYVFPAEAIDRVLLEGFAEEPSRTASTRRLACSLRSSMNC